MERTVVYFEKPGRANTRETLRLAAQEAEQRGVRKIVLASTTGDTARAAAALFSGTQVRLIVVPHQYGFTQTQRFPPDLVVELEQQGHRVHFGTMLFHTDGLYGGGSAEAMAMVLRTICQGMKVCVETLLMAADAGLVAKGEEVIAVSGTRRGADTAVVAFPSTSAALQDLHITEIICKPLQTRSWARGTSPYDVHGERGGRPKASAGRRPRCPGRVRRKPAGEHGAGDNGIRLSDPLQRYTERRRRDSARPVARSAGDHDRRSLRAEGARRSSSPPGSWAGDLRRPSSSTATRSQPSRPPLSTR